MSLCQPVIWSMAAILQLRDSTIIVVLVVLVAAAVVRTRPRAIPLAMILTHSILGAPLGEHKAPTNFFHLDRSWASHRSLFHLFPAVFISFSMVLRQVPSGLPRCLFSGGAQESASSGCRPFCMRKTWPSHVHRLLFTSRTMLFIPVRLQISSLHTFSCHLTFTILRLAMTTTRKSTHGFPFVVHIWVAYGAPLGGPWGRQSSAMKQIRHIGHFWHKPSLS